MNNGATLSPRAQQMFDTIERYYRSGLTQRAFCQKEGITDSTLQYWLRRYRSQGVSASAYGQGAGVIPLHIVLQQDVDNRPWQCRIEYPNGVAIYLQGVSDANWLRELAGVGISSYDYLVCTGSLEMREF